MIRTHSILISAIFSVYCIVATIFLNPFVFLPLQTTLISYTVIALISGGLLYILLRISSKSPDKPIHHVYFVAGIYLVPVICGVLVFLLNYQAETELFLYMSTFLILPIVPISIFILWLLYSDLQNRIVLTTENRENANQSIESIFSIKNERNEVVLEVPIDRIITFEANDNYVITYYKSEADTLEKTMHRISLKKITELLTSIDVTFLRVHKSYLINPDFVSKIKGKSQAYRIELEYFPNEVPVSRAFDIQQIKK